MLCSPLLQRAVPPLLVVLACLLCPAGPRAADPVPYRVTIAPTGQDTLDQTVQAASTLVSLRASGQVGGFALVARARADADRFLAALHSQGYYDGQVAITIAGSKLDDPELPERLDALPEGQEVEVAVTLTLGPRFTIGRISVTGDVPAAARDALGLEPGMPAVAAEVLAARGRLLAALLAQGHALAKVDPPVATLDEAGHKVNVSFAAQPGPRVDLGAITISGAPGVDEDFIRNRLLLHPGEPYDPARFAAARDDLAKLGVFASVRIDPATALDPNGRLPVQVVLAERKRHTVSVGAFLSTDQGGSLTATWTDRNLFGRAEQLDLGAAVTNLGGTASQAMGYNLSATLTLPDWLRRDQSLRLNVIGFREFLQAYDRTGVTASATVSRKLTEHLTVNLGLSATQQQVKQEGVTRNYTLGQLPASLVWDSTDNLLDPTRGARAALTATPTVSFAAGATPFVIGQAAASAYYDFGSQGRSVLAGRVLAGRNTGANLFDIPPDQRFYAGGSATVRGYRFQSVGPAFPSGNPTGGTQVMAGSLEFRQRIGTSWGAVAFVDAGEVSATEAPTGSGGGQTRVGVGLGVRYYTAIGPIRVDIALPTSRPAKSDAFELYIGIGQAF